VRRVLTTRIHVEGPVTAAQPSFAAMTARHRDRSGREWNKQERTRRAHKNAAAGHGERQLGALRVRLWAIRSFAHYMSGAAALRQQDIVKCSIVIDESLLMLTEDCDLGGY